MTGAPQAGLERAFRRVALPLGSYYAVTLALPLANGAAQSGTVFVTHAVVVLVVPPLLVALGYAAHRAVRCTADRIRPAREPTPLVALRRE